MIDESHFQDALDADPSDHGMRLVFADWLKERGDSRADGYMWLGLNQKQPFTGRFLWCWFQKQFPMSAFYFFSLPLDADEMAKVELWHSFDSRLTAEDAFASVYPALVAAHPQEFRLNLEAVA